MVIATVTRATPRFLVTSVASTSSSTAAASTSASSAFHSFARPLLAALPSSGPSSSSSSSSKHPLKSSSRPTSTPLYLSNPSLTQNRSIAGLSKEARRKGQIRKKRALENKAIRKQAQALSQPDPVLGYRPGNIREAGTNDETLWENCELKKVILSKKDVWGLTEDRRGNLVQVDSEASRGTVQEQAAAKKLGGPLRMNFGFTEEDRQLLFKDLPEVTVQDRVIVSLANNQGSDDEIASNEAIAAAINADLQHIEAQESDSTDRLSRSLDLRNASGKGIDVENRRRIVAHFGGGVDTGSVTTQCAIITYRLHLLHEHLSRRSFRKDNVTRRSMTILVHQRAKLLKYLKRKNPQQYRELLPRLGINPRAVEGEIIVPGMPRLSQMM